MMMATTELTHTTLLLSHAKKGGTESLGNAFNAPEMAANTIAPI